MADKKDYESILEKYKAKRVTQFHTTGIKILDEILGGGIDVSGGLYAFWGAQGSGKTTITLQTIRTFCEDGKTVLFNDVERAFNENQQKSFGLKKYVDNGQLIVIEAINFVELEEVVKKLIPSLKPDLFVIDSETSMIPGGKDISVLDNQPGVHAKQSQLVMGLAKNICSDLHIPSIWIFHARANVQLGFSPTPVSSDKKQAGGFGAKHIPDVIMEVSQGAKLKDGDDIIGYNCKLMCEKNKYAAPFKKVEGKLLFGHGISYKYDVIDRCLAEGLIKINGSFYTLPDGSKVQGIRKLYNLDDEKVKEFESFLNK